jgi:hypothetical protein
MQKCIERERKNERENAVLFVAGNQDALRMILAWPNVYRCKVRETGNNAEMWQAWASIQFNIGEWARAAWVKRIQARDLAELLITNNLVYPDGTINGKIETYLNTLAEAKTAQAERTVQSKNISRKKGS